LNEIREALWDAAELIGAAADRLADAAEDQRPEVQATEDHLGAEHGGGSARFLELNPVCQHESGCLNPSAHVHHRDGQGPTGALGLDWSNFLALCASHHGQIENAKGNRGEDGRWSRQ
jgi:hypothetical protein